MTKHIQKRKSQPAASFPNNRQTPGSNWWVNTFGIRSIIVAIVGGLLFYGGISMNEGYQWMWNSLLIGNWKHIQANRQASLEERNLMKLGFNYAYMNFVKKNTPEDAVILLPLRTHLTDAAGNQQLGADMTVKTFVTHFVYPRTVLYQDEKETNPLYNEVTHVAIVAGHGYEELDYEVAEKPAFAVFPKKQPND
jgi:hypothetical protein